MLKQSALKTRTQTSASLAATDTIRAIRAVARIAWVVNPTLIRSQTSNKQVSTFRAASPSMAFQSFDYEEYGRYTCALARSSVQTCAINGIVGYKQATLASSLLIEPARPLVERAIC